MSREPFETMPDVMDAKQLAEALQISKAGAYTNTRTWMNLRPMLCGNLSREFISKLPTRAAANGGRTSVFPMILWALSH